MAEKSPLVFVDGGFSQLPPGDSIEGVALGNLTAGSGLVGGGDLNTGNKRLDVALASNASGVIFVGDSIGLDGVAQVTADSALASGNAGLVLGETALSSGVVAQGEAATALASGNAALEAAVNFVGSSSIELTAASPIGIGSAVGLDDTGGVQSINLVVQDNTDPIVFSSAGVVFRGAATANIQATYDSTNNRIVVAYEDQGNSNYGTAVVGTVSGTSISFGTPTIFESADISQADITYDSNSNRVVIAYQDTANSQYGTAVVGTVSGTSISFGTPAVFNSNRVDYNSITYDSTNNRVVIGFRDFNTGTPFLPGYAIVGTVSGTSITFGSRVQFNGQCSYIDCAFDSSNSRVVISYRDDTNSSSGTAIIGTVSGTSISFGSKVVFSSGSGNYPSAVFDSSNNKIFIAYGDGSNYGTGIVGTVSGTSISFGSPVTFKSGASFYFECAYASESTRIVVAYQDNSNLNYGTASVGLISGTSVSFGSSGVFVSATTESIGIAYDSSNDKIVVPYRDGGNSNYGTAKVADTLYSSSLVPTVSSQNNFIGIAQATAASGTSLNVLLPRAIDFNQTGLNPGYFYYVDPTTSGFTSASGQAASWSGAYNWGPVAKAVSSSGLLLLDTL